MLFQISSSRWLSNTLVNFEDLLRALLDEISDVDLYTYLRDTTKFLEGDYWSWSLFKWLLLCSDGCVGSTNFWAILSNSDGTDAY